MAEIKVITIGRHYCAGGSTIGKLVAEKLGTHAMTERSSTWRHKKVALQ